MRSHAVRGRWSSRARPGQARRPSGTRRSSVRARRGAVALSARPAQAETSFAHAALGDLIRAQDEARARLPSPQRRALETALLLADHDGETPAQQVIALAALGVLRALAEQAPVVVAIDDVQWLDAPSAAVLRFAARRLGDDRVGLLLAQRTAGGEPVPLGLERAFAADRLTRVGFRRSAWERCSACSSCSSNTSRPGPSSIACTICQGAIRSSRSSSHVRFGRARSGSSPASDSRSRWTLSWERGCRRSPRMRCVRSRWPRRWPSRP